MKKILLATCALISSFTFAQLPVGKIQNLNANYRSPAGTGKVQYINLSDFGEYSNADVEVENYNGLLQFSIADKQFELDLSMLGITDAEEINFSNLNFLNETSQINLSISKANAKDSEKDLNMDFSGASVTCKRKVKYDDIKTDLLKNCLDNSNISLSKLNLNKSSFQMKSLVSDDFEIQGGFDLSSFKIDVFNNKFKAETKSSISSGLTIKLEGTSVYKVDESIIEIRIDKAKAGILNIKSKLFDALKDMESESISVREPFIYIDLND